MTGHPPKEDLIMTKMAAFLLLTLAVGNVLAQDARGIIERMQAEQVKRAEGVNTYVVVQTMMGHETYLLFERNVYLDDRGNPVTGFRPLTPAELGRRSADGSGVGGLSADDLRAVAEASPMRSTGLARNAREEMAQAGLPQGLISTAGSNAWGTTRMRGMMGGMRDFRDEAIAGRGASAAGPAERTGNDFPAVAERAVLVGTETVDGRRAFHLRIDDLDQVQRTDDGDEFAMHAADWWIDAEAYVPLRMKFTGTATSQGETRPMTVEQHASDYREVPGSNMYEPFRQVVRIAGVLNAEQRREMEQAEAQLAQLDAQLAGMPEGQRQMILGRMGPQLDMMRSMASGGGVEIVTEVREILVNPTTLPRTAMPLVTPGPSAAPRSVGPGGPASPPAATGSATDLAAARQACLQEKIAAAQDAQQKKRGLNRLMGAVTRTAGRFGNHELGRIAGEINSANATAEDLSEAARDLGITQSEIDACRNPG
jgi:hypothetical protein